MLDCLVIGGGPAGLTAAIYLARFHLSVAVIDSGQSRAALIPLTRNHAGFPDGIAGVDLLDRMRAQARLYGVQIEHDTVVALDHNADGFVARHAPGTLAGRTVLLATGVVNRRPEMIDDASHDRALATGRLRYCPICDGYEVSDKMVAVLGTGDRGCHEALFLRGYTKSITLVAPGPDHDLSAEQSRSLAQAGIALAGPVTAIRLAHAGIVLDLPEGPALFDSLYPALGSDIRSELAGRLGADCSGEGCLMVDAHQRTSVPGLYAAGDVVLGLDQISHAMGEGGVAATTIRNDLAAKAPLRR
ncbi:NAD(P)/FAD-dependent oxidoreductase [Novosphingobium sp. PS1R-30]|uniref:Thioredoxin reductase n=1 Tax=Novosphingobium anseongense TaxID=3133436 RepID=A0ABU8S2D2_9SPHN